MNLKGGCLKKEVKVLQRGAPFTDLWVLWLAGNTRLSKDYYSHQFFLQDLPKKKKSSFWDRLTFFASFWAKPYVFCFFGGISFFILQL